LLIANVVALAPELERAETVLDAYGGVGMFAATVVPERAHRLVIESSRSAAHDARRNLEGLPGEVRRQRFEHWRHRGAPLDVAIADPARTGLKRGGVNALVSAGADVVVLVSCDVAAGARDLGLLREAGYRLEAVRVLDLFAQTHHLEMVSRLVRTTPKR
jgi:23S rRNA (uracil1939-C5)-methyltransferase